MAEVELVEMIKTLHERLNELYAIDSNWRQWGAWPIDVTGSVLHKGATEEEIAEAERKCGHSFPPSYRRFLQLHSAWEHFWGDFTLIGTGRPDVSRASAEIAECAEEQTIKLQKKLSTAFSPDGITAWESEQARFMYLANHLVIGTNFSGALWVYDAYSRRSDGEMTLRHWDISYGAQAPEFATFRDFLEWASSEAQERLRHTREAIENPNESTDDDDDN